LVDDALDYGGLESALGKSIGDDFREGKVTLPVIRAYQQAGTHALESTLGQARKYAGDARQALSIFPDSEWRSTLKELADFVVDRIS